MSEVTYTDSEMMIAVAARMLKGRALSSSALVCRMSPATSRATRSRLTWS